MQLKELEEKLARMRKRGAQDNSVILVGGYADSTSQTEGAYYDDEKNNIIIH